MLHECLACERVFTMGRDGNTGVPIDYASTYCTPECYEQFEAQLKAEVERANASELNPHLDGSDSNSQSSLDINKNTIRAIVNGFNFKVKP